jgi:hypothetical protein
MHIDYGNVWMRACVCVREYLQSDILDNSKYMYTYNMLQTRFSLVITDVGSYITAGVCVDIRITLEILVTES